MSIDILVIGSMNMDYLVYCDKFPEKSETIFGNNFSMRFGGKGANQAVASSRLGAKTAMIGMCGEDPIGDSFIKNLRENDIDTASIFRCDKPSGIAVCTIAEDTNHIIVVKGANDCITKEVIDKNKKLIKEAKLVILQNEIPMEVNYHIIKLCKEFNTTIVYNPAPANSLDFEVIRDVDFIIVNETEIMAMFSDKYGDNENILKNYPNQLILTYGSKGVYFHNGKKLIHIHANKVNAVDTTGAGDTFIGAFCAEFLRSKDLESSIEFANSVSAIQVTRVGAQSSIPYLSELER